MKNVRKAGKTDQTCPSQHCRQEGSPFSLCPKGPLIRTELEHSQQTFSAKDQRATILGTAGHTVCCNYSTLLLQPEGSHRHSQEPYQTRWQTRFGPLAIDCQSLTYRMGLKEGGARRLFYLQTFVENEKLELWKLEKKNVKRMQDLVSSHPCFDPNSDMDKFSCPGQVTDRLWSSASSCPLNNYHGNLNESDNKQLMYSHGVKAKLVIFWTESVHIYHLKYKRNGSVEKYLGLQRLIHRFDTAIPIWKQFLL